MNRWILIAAAVVIVIALLNLLATVVGSLVPILFTAAIAFLLGRLSTGVKVSDVMRRAASRPAAAEKPAEAKRAPAAEKPAPVVQQKPAAPPKPAEAVDDLPQTELKNPDLLLDPDFEIKTPEQIEAEAREREAQMMQQAKAPANDVQAAIEARRKRLLENK